MTLRGIFGAGLIGGIEPPRARFNHSRPEEKFSATPSTPLCDFLKVRTNMLQNTYGFSLWLNYMNEIFI